MNIYLNFSQKSAFAQLLYFLFFVSLGFLLAFFIQLLIVLTQKHQAEALLSNVGLLKLVLVSSQVCIFLIPALFFGYYYSPESLNHNLGIVHTPLRNYGIALLLILIAAPVGSWLIQLNHHIPFSPSLKPLEDAIKQGELEKKQILKQLLTFHSFTDFITTFFVVAITPAVCEELFFRSILNKIILKGTQRIGLSIILTACIFSFIHFQFLGFFARFELGIVLSFVWLMSKSVLPSIFIHIIFNGMQVIAVYVIDDPQFLEKALTDEDIAIPNWLGFSLFVILAFALVYLYKKYKPQMV